MTEKRISHEQYLACALYQFASENPLGTFESQEILNKIKPIEISDTLSRSFFHVCATLWHQNLAVDLGSIISGIMLKNSLAFLFVYWCINLHKNRLLNS